MLEPLERAEGVGAEAREVPRVDRLAGGRPVDPDVLAWWEAVGTLKWGVICMAQASVHLTGLHKSIELAAIGRRVCEQEADVLAMIAPDQWAAAEPTPAPPGATDPGLVS